MAGEIVTVPFHGDVIEAVQDERGVWIPINRPCESMGLDPEGQRQRLSRQAWATTCKLQVVAEDGKSREMFTLHLDCVPMWLATVTAKQIKNVALRPKLVLYQREAARVLADHFYGRTPAGEQSPPEDPLLVQLQALLTVRREQLELKARQDAHSRQIEEVSGQVTAILAEREEAHRHLALVERADSPGQDKTTRARINELVRAYCAATNADHRQVWGELYKEMYYRYSIDARARSRRSGRSQIDEIEAAGMLVDLYCVASERLVLSAPSGAVTP